MIAGIFISGLAQAGKHKGLEMTLARADQGNVALSMQPEQAMLDAVGVADAAVAPCRALAMHASTPGTYYLCADPVYLIPNRDQLIMDNPAHLQLTAAEASQLISEINAHFAADGIELMQLSRRRWVLSSANKPVINALSPYELIGMPIMDYLPSGDKAINWHAWLTEVQSLLHLSTVNQQREDSGLPTVNSLWLWGAGNLPINIESAWHHIVTDDPLMSGLASEYGSSTSEVDVFDWSESIDADDVLVVLTPEVVQKHVGNMESIEHYFNLIHDLWLQPALAAIRRKELSELVVYTESCAPFTLRRSSLLRWWRRRKPMSHYRVSPS